MQRLEKYLRLVATPIHWGSLLKGIAPTIEHSRALRSEPFATIVDIGSNKGQFATFAARQWPQARIICFEPLPPMSRRLAAALAAKRLRIFQCALGEHAAELELQVTERADSSSLLRVGKRQTEVFGTRTASTLRVPVKRLDECLTRAEVVPPALLKIDTQGYELEVLKGAAELLDRFHTIYLEASFEELYEGQPTLDDLCCHLHQHQFKIGGVYNQVEDCRGKPVQADILFQRAPTQLAAR